MDNLAFPKGTQEAAKALLSSFIPRMGADYERQRNYDYGPGQHHFVSRLSPYLRRRLVLESEAVAAAIEAHGLKASEKFIQEVFWRTYFKGWLELRPTVWSDYTQGLVTDLASLETNPKLQARVRVAENGQTGIESFDCWVNELIDTGYLHNHPRMWFASIWIFTLKLPWRIGADFFYRHLLDGDAASNTLSWRWVAGLHTRGKAYAAEAWNIQKFTAGRFHPRDQDFAGVVNPLDDTEPDGLVPTQRLREPLQPDPSLPSLLLLTDEDCRIEDFDLGSIKLVAVASLATSQCRSPRKVADGVIQFERESLEDTALRNQLQLQSFEADSREDGMKALMDYILQSGAKQIVTAYLTQGPTRDALEQQRSLLEANGIRLCEWRRDWDTLTWPHASAGFFKVKQKIPDIISRLVNSKT